LKDTLLTAQKLCDDLKLQAGKEAETIVAAAEVKAQEIIQQAGQRASKLQSEIRELRRLKISFEENLRGQLQSHLKLLGIEEEKQPDPLEETIASPAKKGRG